MIRAILSDIHGNLAAFQSVLKDLESQNVDKVYCLGDIIGYGPDPRECLGLAMDFPINLLGNHEEAVLMGAVGFNPKAKAAIDWTRDQLNLESQPLEVNRDLWNFLGRLKRRHVEDDFLFVHGSPRDPTREYIFNQDWQDERKMEEVFAAPEDVDWKVCFTGHTHYPGVFSQANGQYPYRFHEPASFQSEFPYAEETNKIIVNVGSVGQPRDGDYRASYVILDDTKIYFKRLDYDVQKTVERFKQCPDLPEYLARRLEEGK